jgi:hypothetical protein
MPSHPAILALASMLARRDAKEQFEMAKKPLPDPVVAGPDDETVAIETILRLQDEAEADGLDPSDPTGPLFQFNALVELGAVLEPRFRAGEDRALMLALRLCANHDLVMPEWVSRAYIEKFDRANSLRVLSWDEVFGPIVPPGRQPKRYMEDRVLRPKVYKLCRDKIAAGQPTDEALFEEVGALVGIKKTRASRLYYESRKLFSSYFGPTISKPAANKIRSGQ